MVRDLSDPAQPILRQADNVRRTNSRTRAQSTSVDQGAFRIKSEEGLEVGTSEDPTGSAVVYGILRILGQLLLQGDMSVTGGGKITVGNVVIEPTGNGRITVGIGSAKVVLDGATGKITAGNMTIDPTTGGGAVTFSNGAQLYSASAGNQIEMFSGQTHVTVRETQVSVSTENRGFVLVEEGDPTLDAGIYALGIPAGSGGSYLGIDASNRLVKLSGAGGGDPGDPPAGNPDGYVWPVDPAVFGISDNFAAHVARGSAEPGVDVMCPVGTAVWSPGPGTVTAIQTSPAGATGRYVTFVTDEGDWFRFLHNSSIVASVGQHVDQGVLLAYSGGSGFGSEAYYGPHSHISFKVGYTGSFPGAGALNDFEAYMAAA